KAKGPFAISLQTRNPEKALTITHQVIDRFLSKGPQNRELLAVKKKIINEFPLTIARNDSIATQLRKIGFYQLPLDYLNHYCEKINAVTTKQVKHAFQQHFD